MLDARQCVVKSEGSQPPLSTGPRPQPATIESAPETRRVEESPAGIEAARRAGMRTVGVGLRYANLAADRSVARLDHLPAGAFDELAGDARGPKQRG